jgi:sugar (pentulose or hexulose) kinase
MNKPPAIAIFDVGKTNKKILVFDENLQMLYNHATVLPETADEDGFPCEDIIALTRWVSDSLREVSSKIDHEVKTINFSAYGATLVHVVDNVDLTPPIYNYLKPYPDQLLEKFYAAYGGREEFSLVTASPPLGSLNSGLQLYRMKNERAGMFNNIRCSLHLPQFLSFVFTGQAFSEITSLGCHTALWDFNSNNYHYWVDREGVRSKLPAIAASDHTRTMESSGLTVGIGLHDSSAALIPYLKKYDRDFVLLSTGTWNISMNPFCTKPLTVREVGLDCLCYLSYQGKPVKAARLFAGHVHEESAKKIAEYFHKDNGYHATADYSESIATKLAANPAIEFEPGKMLRPGFFNARDLNSFKTFEEAYHQLMIDIVSFQAASTMLVVEPETRQLFVEGGFNKNKLFMKMLAAKFPNLRVESTDMPDASALGAAMVMGFHHGN